jgi:hypothetical protein
MMVPISLSFSLFCLLGAYTDSPLEGFLYFCVCRICLHVSVLKGWINFLSLPDGLVID